MSGPARRSLWIVALPIALVASMFAWGSAASAAVCTSTTAGQLARWPGDNDATEVAHGRNGTLVGDTTFAAGEVNQAFSFDGNGDTVTVPDSPDWTLDSDFTIDTWVNFTALPSHPQALVAHDQGYGLQPKWILWWRDTNILGLYLDNVAVVSASWTPSPAQWYHVAVTRAGSTFTLYIDGASVGTDTNSLLPQDAAAPITLGSAEDDFYLDGMLDEPEIYQRALSDTEIKAIFDAGGNSRCAISQSTLSLTAPATAFPSDTLTIDGTLALTNAASVDARAISITRSIDGGAATALPDATTAADGTFSFQDTPGAGTATYTATFGGATDISAENASATVVLKKKTSAVSVSVSKSTVKLGDPVIVTAHLKGGFTNKAVTIWGVPYGSSKQKLAQGKVNSKGTLSVSQKPTRKTKYYATYAGDAHWTANTSSSKAVNVVPRWSTKVLGGYATVKGVRLYHYSSLCSPTNSTGCPAATFTLSPSHAGQRVYFQGRYCHNGKCINDSGSWKLNRKSQTSVFIYYGDKSVIGWTLNFRMRFAGDADHTASTSAWVKTKVTA